MAPDDAGSVPARRRTLLALATIAICLVLTGCSGGGATTGDGAQVESELTRQINDLDFEDVTCPEEPKLEQGHDFECTARSGNGANTIIHVSQPDKAGEMKFSIAKNEVMSVPVAGKILQDRLAASGISAQIYCGDRQRLTVDEGTTLVCRATRTNGATENYTIRAHPTNDDVTVTVE